MRSSLVRTFNRRQFLDLHGDGTGAQLPGSEGHDENVFTILQGVGVGLFARDLAGDTFTSRADWGGTKEMKLDRLSQCTLVDLVAEQVSPAPPSYEFAARDYAVEAVWQSWIGLADLFVQYSAGIITARDGLVVDDDRDALISRIESFRDSRLPDEALLESFGVSAKKGWDLGKARQRLAQISDIGSEVRHVAWRPFDQRWIFYDGSLVWGRAFPTMQHVLNGDNVMLAVCKQLKKRTEPWAHVFVSTVLAESGYVSNRSKEITTYFPLTLQSQDGTLELDESSLNMDADGLDAFLDEAAPGVEGAEKGRLAFNIIYALMHSEAYRQKYVDQLARGFPRFPNMRDSGLAYELADLGAQLLAAHRPGGYVALPAVASYQGPGNSVVGKVGWSNGTVWLDATLSAGAGQGGGGAFSGVSAEAWSFRIGSYQVLQKWLKDRKGHALSEDEREHYAGIVASICQTIRLMGKIDSLIEGRGGWPTAFDASADRHG
jgi:predicted helicase